MLALINNLMLPYAVQRIAEAGPLTRRLTRRAQQAEREPVTTSDELPTPPVSRMTYDLTRFRMEQERPQVIATCKEMYRTDPRASGVIQTLARDATQGDLSISVTDGPQADRAQEIINETLARLRLHTRLDDWLRRALITGDAFVELSADRDGIIRECTLKPTLEMYRQSDEYDRFDDPTRAYWQTPDPYLAGMWYPGMQPPRHAIWFAEWQIIQARWQHDEGSRYGYPLFGAARKAYKRIDEGELDIAVRRKTRAGMKYLHSLKNASEAELEAYIERNKDALDNPFAAISDFFVNTETTIQTLQGDARLDEIGDVWHHISTWETASPVPLELLGYGANLNRDVLEEKLAQYDRSLMSVTAWLDAQIIRPLIDRQLLLSGLLAPMYTYEVVRPPRQQLTPAQAAEVARAVASLRATGLFGDEQLVRIAAEMLPAIDLDTALQWLALQPDETARLGGM
jgi:hypothetical protein